MSKDTEHKQDTEHVAEGWFYQLGNIRKIIIGLVVVCLGLLAAEFLCFYVLAEPLHIEFHPHFEAEGIFGFHAVFGFVAFVVVVLLGKGLRLIISRPEDYYDE